MNLWLFLTWNSSRLLALPPVIQAPFLSSQCPYDVIPVLDTGMTSL
ncbi:MULTISPECIES: hypothetical protein [unclassified Wolbachia]|nr:MULTISPECIES: hypothetical protein [unclassified Wolbachia]